MATIPDEIPRRFTVGDSAQWYVSDADYSPDDGWALSVAFVKSATASIELTGVDNGDGRWLVTVDPGTDNFTAGVWGYQAFVTQGSERHTLAKGQIEIQEKYDGQSGGYDTRTYERKLLDAIESILEGRDDDVSSYSIGGRALTRIPLAELLEARSLLKIEVQRQERAQRLAKGLPDPKQIKVRF